MGALDARNVANRAFGGDVPNAGVVIIDAEGNVAFRGSDANKGSTFYMMPGNPPVPFQDLKANVEKYFDQGLLAGLQVPVQGKMVVKLLKAGNLAQAQAVLASLKGDLVATFKKTLEERLEALRKKKRELFDGLLKAEKVWDAYKAGQSYVRCFPKAPDVAEVKESIKGLQTNAIVKSNLAAKESFSRIAASGFGSRSSKSAAQQMTPAAEAVAAKYADTEYGRHAANLAK